MLIALSLLISPATSVISGIAIVCPSVIVWKPETSLLRCVGSFSFTLYEPLDGIVLLKSIVPLKLPEAEAYVMLPVADVTIAPALSRICTSTFLVVVWGVLLLKLALVGLVLSPLLPIPCKKTLKESFVELGNGVGVGVEVGVGAV